MGSWCHHGRAGGALPFRESEGLGVRLRPRASVSPGDGAEQPSAGSAAGHPGEVGTPRCPLATRSGTEVTAAPPALHLPASSCFLHFLPEPFLARRCLCRCACAHAGRRERKRRLGRGRAGPDGPPSPGRPGTAQACDELCLVSGRSPAGCGDAPRHRRAPRDSSDLPAVPGKELCPAAQPVRTLIPPWPGGLCVGRALGGPEHPDRWGLEVKVSLSAVGSGQEGDGDILVLEQVTRVCPQPPGTTGRSSVSLQSPVPSQARAGLVLPLG